MSLLVLGGCVELRVGAGDVLTEAGDFPRCPTGAQFEKRKTKKGTLQLCLRRDGVRDGPWSRYDQRGHRRIRGAFRLGRRDGLWTRWHQNGRKQTEGSFAGGKPTGLWRSWYPNGQTKERATFVAGRYHGPILRWWSNGIKKARGRYHRGQRVGRWVVWSDKGRVLAQQDYPEELTADASSSSSDRN